MLRLEKLALLVLLSDDHLSPRVKFLSCFPHYAYNVLYKQGPIDPKEEAHVLGKTATSAGDWTSYLNTVNLDGLDVGFVKQNGIPGVTMPSIAFAISGGGDR